MALSAYDDKQTGGGARVTGNTIPGTTPPKPAGSNVFGDEAKVDAARQSPEAALSALRAKLGGVNMGGKIGQYAETQMARALQAYLGMLGIGGAGAGDPLAIANQGINMFADRLNSGQGVGGFLRENANQVLNGSTAGDGTKIPGVDFSTMKSDEIMNILNLLNGAGTFGLGPMAQYGNDNALEQMQYQVDKADLAGQQQAGAPSILNTGGGRQKFQNLIQRYLALK